MQIHVSPTLASLFVARSTTEVATRAIVTPGSLEEQMISPRIATSFWRYCYLQKRARGNRAETRTCIEERYNKVSLGLGFLVVHGLTN
mmetsp:Transcript_35862/g.57172  ORF Transcript_35862/g.57172 Transcript_35862/m.57172 type:complete len:88 (-) Transcript_35862:156-419(-)